MSQGVPSFAGSLFSAEAVRPALARALAAVAGARACLLLAADGRLLALAAAAAPPADSDRADVVAAVAAQAFQEYATAAAGSLEAPALQFLVLVHVEH